MYTPLNGISEFSKLLFVGLGKRAKAQKGIAIVLFTIACILGSALPLPLISSSGSSTAIAQTVDERKAEAERLVGEANQLWQRGQFQPALELFQQALRIYREIDDHHGEAKALIGFGIVYNYQKHYSQALGSFQQALVLMREMEDRYGEANALNNIGLIQHNLGQHEQALTAYQQALAIVRYIDNRHGEATTLSNIGAIYHDQRQYEKALKYYQQALSIYQKIEDRSGIAKTLFNTGQIYNLQGHYKQALNYFQPALAIYKNLNEPYIQGTIISDIGFAFSRLGRYSQALELFQQALLLHHQIGDRAGKAKTLNFLGLVYKDLLRYDQALIYFVQALALRQEVGDRKGEGETLNNLGLASMNLGQYERSLDYYHQALRIQRDIRDRVGESTTLNNTGSLYLTLKQYKQALEYLQQALTLAREINYRDQVGVALNDIGVTYAELGRYPQALDSYQQALVIQRELGDRTSEVTTLSNMGVIFLRSNQFADAEASFRASLAVMEALRSSDLSDADKVALFQREFANYIALQQTLIAQNKTEVALEVSEQGRTRPFVQLLATRLAEPKAAEIITKAPDLAAIQSIAQQQQATLVEYSVINTSVGNPTLYVWVIQPTGEIHFQSVDLARLDRSLSDLIATSREFIGARNRSQPAEIVLELTPEAQQRRLAQQQQNLQQLYQLLIAPIARWLPTNPNERVIFIPQKELFLVPFPALLDANGKYLIENHTILTTPSIQVLNLTHQQRQRIGTSSLPIPSNQVLVVGNPIMPTVPNYTDGTASQLSSLPGAEKEAFEIAKTFDTEPVMRERATETDVVERMPNARIIHLATHGLLEYGVPQDSELVNSGVLDIGLLDFSGAIALSPSAKDDGLLTSAEILKMKLKAELVVLSACDTGRGRITGDGVIGLSRSLIAAGVPSVIVSLWSVPDAPTAGLMSEFYRQWQQNPDKAKALRQAMLITMQNHPNPRDWAAFTLIGESE